MNYFQESSSTVLLCWLLVLIVVTFIIRYYWKRRWLFYYGWKIQGPLSFPLIGNAHKLLNGSEDFVHKVIEEFSKYKYVFRLWICHNLVIINPKPEELRILLNKYVDKSYMYKFSYDVFKHGLLTAPEYIWKGHRKIINTSFSATILNNFIEVFERQSKLLVKDLEKFCENDKIDFLPVLWRSTLNVACETLMDIDSGLLTGQDEFIENVAKAGELIFCRIITPWYMFDFTWNLSSSATKLKYLASKCFKFSEKVIELRKHIRLTTNSQETKQNRYNASDDINKRFLNYLFEMAKKDGSFNDEKILIETQTMLITASETTAISLGLLLLVLSIYTEVQEKVHQELYSVFGDGERNITLDDLNKLNYTEAVIKETLRLLPVVPLVLRTIDKDFELNSNVYPKGSVLAIPIISLHRSPELWDDPLNFNPERFLTEKSKYLHPCAFMPFSFGARNCIGLKYGMLSIKVMISNILRNYEVLPAIYKSIWDIKMSFTMVVRPVDGCRVILRQKEK